MEDCNVRSTQFLKMIPRTESLQHVGPRSLHTAGQIVVVSAGRIRWLIAGTAAATEANSARRMAVGRILGTLKGLDGCMGGKIPKIASAVNTNEYDADDFERSTLHQQKGTMVNYIQDFFDPKQNMVASDVEKKAFRLVPSTL